jgi:hypothetical protein
MKIRNIEISGLKKRFCPVLFLLVFLLSFIQDVYGYLDPGTGSYVLQLIIAFFVAALYTSKIIRKKIFGFFKLTFSRRKHAHKSDERADQS